MKKAIVIVGTMLVIGSAIFGTKLYLSFQDLLRKPVTSTAESPGPADSLSSDATDGFSKPVAQDDISPVVVEFPEYQSAVTFQNLDEEQLAEIRGWNTQHGYFNYYRDYGRLTETELTQLTQAGDVGAFHALAAKYALDDPQRSIDFYQSAATQGSTYALLLIGELYMFHAGSNSLLGESNSEKGAQVQALAYSFAAQLLGDNVAAGRRSEQFLGAADSSIALDSKHLDTACENAKQIASDISKARVREGQTEIDKAPAPYTRVVKDYASVQMICGNG